MALMLLALPSCMLWNCSALVGVTWLLLPATGSCLFPQPGNPLTSHGSGKLSLPPASPGERRLRDRAAAPREPAVLVAGLEPSWGSGVPSLPTAAEGSGVCSACWRVALCCALSFVGLSLISSAHE